MDGSSEFKSVIVNIEHLTIVRAIRNALVNIIPVLMIGAFSLILQTFPLPAYQAALQTTAGQFMLQLFQLVYGATFGVLSVYMTLSISRSYIKLRSNSNISTFGAMTASMLCFFILAGAYLPDFSTEHMGPKSMFLAIITGLGASELFHILHGALHKKKPAILSTGVDRNFNRMLSNLFPIALTAAAFALLNAVVVRIANVDSFRMVLNSFFNWIFSFGEVGFAKGFLFVLLSSLLWFFGIHGSDTLEGAMQTYFTPGLAANQAAIAEGGKPEVILTKEFFDSFILMGGCGATICLLIAILIFSRNRSRKDLGMAATFPMLFNINELMVFGLPIIFNPIMFIPFITVPLVCYTVSYSAIYFGLVPYITEEVAWTTPVILSGFHTTGSIAGSLLQIFNIVIGVLIYCPFVRYLDSNSETVIKRDYKEFLDYFIANEQIIGRVKLTELGNNYGDFARELCADLKGNLEKSVVLGYQPQYAYDGRCLGAEALLRWKHPILGMLYPPLVVKLAEEGGFLIDLEELVVRRVMEDRPKALELLGENAKISFNVTGTTVVKPQYLEFCEQMNEKYKFEGKHLCLEVTEQATLSFDDTTLDALRRLHSMGLMLAIDDFSMGNTSIHYLKDDLFDMIKLDGSLVQGLFKHENSREIISSIVKLAKTLNLVVLAEFVETEKQRDALHELGCDNYQGYLYSPAVMLK